MSLEFLKQEYWSKLQLPNLEDFPHPGIEPASLESPTFAGGLFTTAPPGKP